MKGNFQQNYCTNQCEMFIKFKNCSYEVANNLMLQMEVYKYLLVSHAKILFLITMHLYLNLLTAAMIAYESSLTTKYDDSSIMSKMLARV